MKNFFKEFKNFILRGNVLDMAIGVIIGAAFKAIVDSLTGDIISPLIGIFAKTDFSSMTCTINSVEIRYGAFLTAVINFLIMAFVIFVFLKIVNGITNRFKKEQEAAPATTKKCPFCISEIDIAAVKCPNCTSDIPEFDIESK